MVWQQFGGSLAAVGGCMEDSGLVSEWTAGGGGSGAHCPHCPQSPCHPKCQCQYLYLRWAPHILGTGGGGGSGGCPVIGDHGPIPNCPAVRPSLKPTEGLPQCCRGPKHSEKNTGTPGTLTPTLSDFPSTVAVVLLASSTITQCALRECHRVTARWRATRLPETVSAAAKEAASNRTKR